MHQEFKYITVWSLGLVSLHFSGITYRAGESGFNKIQVTKLREVYLNPSLKIKAESWNMSVQIALRKYIYEIIYNPAGQYKN